MQHDSFSFVELADCYGVHSDIKIRFSERNQQGYPLVDQPVKKTLHDSNDAISNLDVVVDKFKDKFLLSQSYRKGLYSEKILVLLWESILT